MNDRSKRLYIKWVILILIVISGVMVLITTESIQQDDVRQKGEADRLPEEKKFGYFVREELVGRDIPLNEDDFKQLRRGQHIETVYYSFMSSMPTPGVIQTIGMYDGEIIYSFTYNRYSYETVPMMEWPYYKIDENTYAVLFFDFGLTSLSSLNHIEIWDAEGNKLREIELE